MKHENENIIRENLNMLFASLGGMNSAFAFQADELFRLKEGELDAYMAYEMISSECERISSLPYFGTSGWLYALSEYAYTVLGKGDVDELVFSGFSAPESTYTADSGRVSYLKNKFTLSAFDKFAEYLPDAKSTYSDSFEDSCQDVYNGLCDFCILPIANSRDGALSVFRNLISKYDLHICITVDIPDSSGTVTTLALLSTYLLMPQNKRIDGYRFEFCISTASNESLCGILTAAERHGLSLINVVSQGVGTESPSLQFTFSAGSTTYDKLRSYIFCLSAIFPSFTLKGLYKHIN